MATTHTQLKKADDSAIYPVVDMTDIYNKVYPVGSLYWSSKNTDPSTLFGGTWERITDKFIWAMSDSATVNDTGGNDSVTLSEDNLPSHTHYMRHYHTRGDQEIYGYIRRGLGDELFQGSEGTNGGALWGETYVSSGYAVGNSNREYSGNVYISISASKNWVGKSSVPVTSDGSTGKDWTDYTGGSKAFSIMPPHINKYCWERTALA